MQGIRDKAHKHGPGSDMEMRRWVQVISWAVFVIAGIAVLKLVDCCDQPRFCTPQSLLSQEQREQLFRFPKSLYLATKDDLMQAKGIGEKRAQDILEFLRLHPQLKKMNELEQIKGIGEVYRRELEKLFYLP